MKSKYIIDSTGVGKVTLQLISGRGAGTIKDYIDLWAEMKADVPHVLLDECKCGKVTQSQTMLGHLVLSTTTSITASMLISLQKRGWSLTPKPDYLWM